YGSRREPSPKRWLRQVHRFDVCMGQARRDQSPHQRTLRRRCIACVYPAGEPQRQIRRSALGDVGRDCCMRSFILSVVLALTVPLWGVEPVAGVKDFEFTADAFQHMDRWYPMAKIAKGADGAE